MDTVSRGRRLEGCVLVPEGWVRGAISFGARVEEIRGERVEGPSPGEDLILPGFVDLHVHGGGGADVMAGDGAVEILARLHARCGTTSLLATTVTAPPEALRRACADVGRAARERAEGAARVLGVHLEGPYINPAVLGAQPNSTRPGDLEEVRALAALAPIRVITVAPEMPGNLELVRQLARQGIAVQIGHTQGTFEDGAEALQVGARGFTHLFNAMTPLHHRRPGMAGAALALAEYAEIVPDLVHVHPGAIRAALRSIPRLYCVTDATAGAGMPEGVYRLGSHAVERRAGAVYLRDGTLAGSVLTLDRALRNLVSLGVSVADAVRRVSTFPADYLGIPDRGRLARGCWADIVVADSLLQVKSVCVEGDPV